MVQPATKIVDRSLRVESSTRIARYVARDVSFSLTYNDPQCCPTFENRDRERAGRDSINNGRVTIHSEDLVHALNIILTRGGAIPKRRISRSCSRGPVAPLYGAS